MPPAEGEAATPAVEARAEVPEVPVEGEGKASEAATTESAQAPAIEEDASTTKGEKSEKADEVESNVEAPKDTEDQPVVVKGDEAKPGEGEETKAGVEGEVKAADSATPAENPDNAANPPENVDKLETNATIDDKSAEKSESKEAAAPSSTEPKLDLTNEPASEESKEKDAPNAGEPDQDMANNTSNASAEESKETPVETKEPEPEAQKNAPEGEAREEAATNVKSTTQVQETEPNAQVETESLESSMELNDSTVAETATGTETSIPDEEKEKASNDAEESPKQEITAEESQVVEQAKEATAPAQDHDYEDVTPLNSVADEVMLSTEYEDVPLDVAPVEDKPQPAVPQPLGKTPEPVSKAESPTPIPPVEEANAAEPVAAVEIAPEKSQTPVAVEPNTDVPPVVSPRHKRNRDSFVETKEGIVDDLEFIKAKLATPPTAPAKGERASKEAAEIPESTKGTEEPERTKEVVENVEKANETVKEEKAEAKPEFARECIPPVRPQRSRTRPGARLSVPDWQPPKQTLFDYLISCFKPQAH